MPIFQYIGLGRPPLRIFHSRPILRTLKSPGQPSHQERPRRIRRVSPTCDTVRIRTRSHDVSCSSRHVEIKHPASSSTLPGSRLRSSRQRLLHHHLPIRLLEQQQQRLAPRLRPRPLWAFPGLSFSFVRVLVFYADQSERLHDVISFIAKGTAHGAVLIDVWFVYLMAGVEIFRRNVRHKSGGVH